MHHRRAILSNCNCPLPGCGSAAVATVLDFVPYFLPFFSPGKWSLAYCAYLGGEVSFFYCFVMLLQAFSCSVSSSNKVAMLGGFSLEVERHSFGFGVGEAGNAGGAVVTVQSAAGDGAG